MSDLLSRYAECLFWFGRYTERTTCLARLLEVQTSFDRGHAGVSTKWDWILTLYDDHKRFNELYEKPDAQSIIRFYVDDRNNFGSLISSISAARENARTLRAILPTELWHQVNTFYNRFRSLPSDALSSNRLAHTCQLVKKECYAQLGVAEATIYRDEAWHFFLLGVLVERTDQMSRLLDVRFAQSKYQSQTNLDGLGDFGFWSVLLRSVAAQQAFLRISASQRDPGTVARFLIFDNSLPRSIAFCVSELDRTVNDLRSDYGLLGAARSLEKIDIMRQLLAHASQDKSLVDNLHEFNDSVQEHLISLTNELAYAFFGMPRPQAQTSATAASTTTQFQSQN
jgi:uncharacterized alpha-E superfamily protein